MESETTGFTGTALAAVARTNKMWTLIVRWMEIFYSVNSILLLRFFFFVIHRNMAGVASMLGEVRHLLVWLGILVGRRCTGGIY